jgi:hypothetical protein|eukprot:COSAG01_NODE_3681_length_5802_cov_4.141855_4_plen_129_part_00
MGMSLPEDTGPEGSDGLVLKDMALHSVVRDMITRRQVFFPQYGVLPGTYGQPMANGFPETFWGTMTMALELGLEEYSQGVMENWLKYYVRNNGTTMYNHIGMTAHGRELTVFAQFYRYTGDSKGLLLK